MGTFMPADKTSVSTPALSDLHVVEQGGVLKKETNTQILSLITPQNINPLSLQWQLDTNTWAWSSNDANAQIDVFNINANATGYMFVGQKVKYTQTSVKYGIVVKVGTFTGSLTPITIYSGGKPTAQPSWGRLANATITNPYFSTTLRPLNFPMTDSSLTNPWQFEITSTEDCYKNSPVAGTWYGGTVNPWSVGSAITGYIGIGLWDIEYFARNLFQYFVSPACTLSYTDGSEDNTNFTMFDYNNNGLGAYSRKDRILLATTKQHWLLCKNSVGTSSLGIYGTSEKTIIRIQCAYL